ncbi:MAG: flagellin lysine-N-methylase [Candidatus Fimenecus sp.]
MKVFAPRIYEAFRCIAEKCRHNCCIGWEIDIDEATLAFYRAQSGKFGVRLRQNIAGTDDCASFRLDANERCPFLNGQNLCDIYLTLGENALCQICRDHPRFRNFFTDRTEVGLGLCCETAARLLLCNDAPFALTQLSDDGEADAPTPEETAFFAFRARLFSMAQDRRLPLTRRLQTILDICSAHLPRNSPAAWVDFYSALERLDRGWDTVLEKLRTLPPDEFAASFSKDCEPFFENLLCCFLYRHLAGALDDGNLSVRTAFCAHGVQLLWALYRVHAKKYASFNTDLALDLVRQYSTEIEYSDENLKAVFDILSADC